MAHPKKHAKRYRPSDFTYEPESGTCLCPAGKHLYQNGSNCVHNGYLSSKFSGTLRDCLPCDQRNQCLRTPDKTKVRQVNFFRGKAGSEKESYTGLLTARTGRLATDDALRRWNRYSATSAITNDLTALPCEANRRSIRNGNSIAPSITLRSWRITGMG